ncbi:MAG: transglutaminase family protein [Actinomycetota bacterium]
MQVHVGCEFRYEVDQPAPTVWQVRPRRDGTPQVIQESWASDPAVEVASYQDSFGNYCDRLTLPSGLSRVAYDAVVEVSPSQDDADPEAPWVPVGQLPPETLLYLLPSRFCHPELIRGRAWELFGTIPPGYRQVQGICDWVHANISFGYGSSTSICTALDVLQRGSGVCRDFTHLGVTLCRALNIPARYICGYLPDIGVVPPDSHMDFCAWFEAYLGGRWWTFDPRNNQRRIGRVVIARGRDAVDVAMVTAYGLVELKDMTVWADEVKEA